MEEGQSAKEDAGRGDPGRKDRAVASVENALNSGAFSGAHEKQA